MKKKIKPRLDYSIIIMRDDNRMRTFRLKYGTLRFLKFMMFILVTIGIAGCIAAYHYHERFRTLQTRHSTQRQELIALKMQLEQFTNIRTLASNTGSPMSTLLNEELEGLDVAQPPDDADQTVPQSQFQNNNPNNIPGINEGAAQPDEAPQTQQETANQGTQSGQLSAEAAEMLSLPKIDSDESNLRINVFNAQAADRKRILLSYTINTVEPNRTVGTVSHSFITTDGKLLELTPRFGNNIKFVINHGRAMESGFNLPQDMNPQDIATILVSIVMEDGKKLVEPFEVTF